MSGKSRPMIMVRSVRMRATAGNEIRKSNGKVHHRVWLLASESARDFAHRLTAKAARKLAAELISAAVKVEAKP